MLASVEVTGACSSATGSWRELPALCDESGVIESGKHSRTTGFDIATNKVESCLRRGGVDPSREIPDEDMAAAKRAVYSDDPQVLAEADIIIVAVPTPVDEAHNPDFAPLIGASKSAGAHMKKGAIVVYKSTVYPGATEGVCIPVLEQASGMKWKQDFFVGYSPDVSTRATASTCSPV